MSGLTTNGPVVLVAGSLHHDIMVEAPTLPRRDETTVGSRWYPKFGGKGGNQAIAAARAGRSRMLGAVGDDGFAEFLRAGLRAGGVDDRFVHSVRDMGSGISIAISDPSGDYAAIIVSGANVAIDAAALKDEALWQDVALLLLQNEVAPALNLSAAQVARTRGIPVVLNAAPTCPLDPALKACLSLLIVNAVEAEQLGSAPVNDLEGAAAAVIALSDLAPSIIVTAGAHGLGAIDRGRMFTLPAEPVKVVSSHGAGDAYCGTLAAALARGLPLEPACLLARRAAADHVAGRGRMEAGNTVVHD